MRKLLLVLALIMLAVTAGCGQRDIEPQFQGILRVHVGEYESGTGSSTELKSSGSLRAGFTSSKPEGTRWEADIDYRIISSSLAADNYHITITFLSPSGVRERYEKTVSYRGYENTEVFANDWMVVSLDPINSNSQQDVGDNPIYAPGEKR